MPVCKDLSIWEKMDFLYKNAVRIAKEHPSEAAQAAIKEIENDKDLVELELQKSKLLLAVNQGMGAKTLLQ